MYRGLAEGEQMPIQDIQDRVLVQEIINALSTTIPIGNTGLLSDRIPVGFLYPEGHRNYQVFL